MSHDADKLIRQLSLVAFLMAERRPLTARDVKGNVEGYSEMSDEAFARRFYSDRAELTALGVPLSSQRDEFTGEELYTLRSENYFLDQLDLDEDELAALQTALYTLEGKFAYAEPLRLALQNLALGRPGFRHAPTATAERVRVTAPDYSPELAARLSKLESAISKQRTIQFRYWTPARDRETERTARTPMRSVSTRASGTSSATISTATPRGRSGSRASAPTSGSRHAASGTSACPRSSTSRRIASRGHGRSGRRSEIARIGVQGDTAWWVHRTLADAGAVVDGVFETALCDPRAARVVDPAPERQGGAARAGRASRRGARGARACSASGTRARRPRRRASVDADARPAVERTPAGPVAPERFGVLQALLAHLLASCGEERSADLDADELAERFSLPREELQETLSLLNLVNFGGGCYTVYAQVDEDDERRPRRQGALRRRLPQGAEADAARGAGDPARDRVRRADDRRGGRHAARPRAAKARGDLRPVRARARRLDARRRRRGGARPHALATGPRSAASSSSSTSRRARRSRRHGSSSRTRSSGSCRSGASTPGIGRSTGRAPTGSTGCAPRGSRASASSRATGFDPNYLRGARRRAPLARAADRPLEARAGRAGAHRQVCDRRRHVQDGGVAALRGARRPWRDRRARAAAMRRAVAARAQALQSELGLSPRRKRTAERA